MTFPSDGVHRSERVYDTEIAGLVSQIFDICKREDLPLLLSVGMRLRAGDGVCLTVLQSESFPGASNRCQLGAGIMRGHEDFDTAAGLAITKHHPPGDAS
jgi:hypothetical protein